MRRKIFFYSLLILLSGVIYAESSFSLIFLVTGVCIASAIAEGYYIQPLIASAIALGICCKSGSVCSISFLLGGLLPGAIIGIGFRKRLTLSVLTVSGGICFIAKWVWLYRSYYLENGSNMFEDASRDMLKIMKSNIGDALALYGMSGDDKTTKFVSDILDKVTKFTNIVVPATLIIFSCGAAFIIIMCTKRRVYKNGKASPVISFSEIYAPPSVLIILLVSVIGLFSEGQIMYFAMNIFFIVFAYVFVCGVSVADYYLRKRISASFLRLTIYILFGTAFSFIIPQILYMGIFITGVSDTIFDYRHIRGKPLPPAE